MNTIDIDFMPIDQALSDDADYSVVFTYNLTPDCCSDCRSEDSFLDDGLDETAITRSYSARGVTGMMEAFAQVLALIDKLDLGLGTEDPTFVQGRLDDLIQRQAEAPHRLAEVRAEIAELDAAVQADAGEGSEDDQDEILNKRSLLIDREEALSHFIATGKAHVALAQGRANFANKIAEIVQEVKAGTLDLNDPLDNDEHRYGWGLVPAYESRRTVGALIYYYVKQLADTETTRLEVKTA